MYSTLIFKPIFILFYPKILNLKQLQRVLNIFYVSIPVLYKFFKNCSTNKKNVKIIRSTKVNTRCVSETKFPHSNVNFISETHQVLYRDLRGSIC